MWITLENIVAHNKEFIHSMLPIESYNDCSLGENHEQEDDEKASEPLLSVIFSNDQYYIHQAKSYKRGIGLG